MSQWICKAWELPSVKAAPEVERFLKMPFSPQANDYDKATVLLVYLPAGNTSGLHSHPDSDELMYFMGRGEATLGDEHAQIENDFIMLAPKGVKHEVRNTSDAEMLKVFCVFIPPVKNNPLYDKLAEKTRQAMQGRR